MKLRISTKPFEFKGKIYRLQTYTPDIITLKNLKLENTLSKPPVHVDCK
jgi:hypothetical protein